MHFIKQVLAAVHEAESQGLLPGTPTSVLTGFSGDKLVGTLQRATKLFAGDDTACYLEIGVFQGLTLLSVASVNTETPCYGIDNFSHYDVDGKNQAIYHERAKAIGVKNAHLLNKDYEDALESLDKDLGGRKLGVYFVDGPHDYRSQLMCLELALPYLHENAVILVDDSNYRHVRQANRDFLRTHPDFKMLFESYTPCHPQHMTAEQEATSRKGWWNGINIIVRDHANVLPVMYPPTERSRLMYELEHDLHALRTCEGNLDGALAAQSLADLNPLRCAYYLGRFFTKWQKHGKSWRTRKRVANTYSETLPQSHYNELPT